MRLNAEQLEKVMRQLNSVPAGTHEIAQMVRLTCKHGTQWSIVFCRCGYNGQESVPRGTSSIDPLHSFLAEDCPPSRMHDWQTIECQSCPSTNPALVLAGLQEVADALGIELDPATLPDNLRDVYERQHGAVQALLVEMGLTVATTNEG